MQPEQSPFDFILNSGDASKRPSMPSGGGSSIIKRALIVGVIALVVIVLGIIVMSVLGGDGGSRTALLSVSQQQSETVRVAELVLADASSQTVKNVSINTSVSVASDQKQLANAMGLGGIVIGEKELLLSQNADTDKLLKDAKAAGTFNTTALEILDKQIIAYQLALQSAFNKVSLAELKQSLQTAFSNADLLKNQIESTQP